MQKCLKCKILEKFDNQKFLTQSYFSFDDIINHKTFLANGYLTFPCFFPTGVENCYFL